MAEQGLLSADDLLYKLGSSSEKQVWVSQALWVSQELNNGACQMGPWTRKGEVDIPYNDPHIRKRKDVILISVVRGDRDGKIKDGESKRAYEEFGGINVHSTGIPLANRECDIEMGEGYTQAEGGLDKTENKVAPNDAQIKGGGRRVNGWGEVLDLTPEELAAKRYNDQFIDMRVRDSQCISLW